MINQQNYMDTLVSTLDWKYIQGDSTMTIDIHILDEVKFYTLAKDDCFLSCHSSSTDAYNHYNIWE